jgi:hypothetical protein
MSSHHHGSRKSTIEPSLWIRSIAVANSSVTSMTPSLSDTRLKSNRDEETLLVMATRSRAAFESESLAFVLNTPWVAAAKTVLKELLVPPSQWRMPWLN